MSRPKGINYKGKYKAHFSRLAAYVGRVQTVYDTLNGEIAKIVSGTDYDGSVPFRWRDFPETRKAFEEVQSSFVTQMRGIVYSGTSDEWKQSNLVQDLLADKVLKFYGSRSGGQKHKVYYQTNSDALKAFQQRKDKGMNLSSKLWNQSKSYKEELEYAISSGIEKGTSAVTLSKRLSKYLADFDSLKKDYKEKFGKAVKCTDCEYRSIRLARSEINMAYRSAEQERWKQFDFVLGYEVKLTQNGRHVQDICDDLKGKYPKDFVFVGWHPNCMCYVIPVLKSEEEFFGESESQYIEDVPDGFKKWISDNEKRIEAAKEHDTLPYWYKDNLSYVGSISKDQDYSKVEKFFTDEEKKKWSLSEDTRKELLSRGFKERNLISIEDFNTGPMSGFNVVEFDKQWEQIMDEYHVLIKTKELSGMNNATLRYVGLTESGEEVELSRTFKFEKIDGKRVPVVYHNLFVLPEELQAKGISKRTFRNLISQYEQIGVSRAYIHAAVTKGAYVWGKYGAIAEKQDILLIVERALKKSRISQIEFDEINSYLSRFDEMIPMAPLSYAPYGKRLLLGESWYGYIDLADESELNYLHQYLGL